MNLNGTFIHIDFIKENLFNPDYRDAYDIMLNNGDNYAHFGINGAFLYSFIKNVETLLQ